MEIMKGLYTQGLLCSASDAHSHSIALGNFFFKAPFCALEHRKH